MKSKSFLETYQVKALFRITIYGALLMALLGSALGQNTQTDFDHQANFSQYKTFSWAAIRARDSLWGARIKSAVDAQLASKGWTQVDNGAVNTQPANSQPQAENGPKFPFPPPPPPAAAQQEPALSCPTSAPCVVVMAVLTTETQRSLNGFFDSFGGGLGGWGGFRDGSINISAQDYQAGTLVVYMFDAKTKQLLWRGSAEGTLSDKAEKNEKKLEKAVAKMFKDFPPGTTKHSM